ncbi:MAG: hypothetical protein JSS62_05355 [Verrucomicrobia bacterium]|nr:hypothetical protein [Verrucomicrobiota bacterium]MBS0647272.1 hypothetical protein [Verrucomicrobiota bacterium]
MDSLSSSQGVLVSAHQEGVAEGNPQIFTLPQEMLLIIFSYLRAVSDQMAFLGTCKHFQAEVLTTFAANKYLSASHLRDVEMLIAGMEAGYVRAIAYHELAKVQVSRMEFVLAREALDRALEDIEVGVEHLDPSLLVMTFLEWKTTSERARYTHEDSQYFLERALTTISTIPSVSRAVKAYLQLVRDDGRDTLFTRHLLQQAIGIAVAQPSFKEKIDCLTLCVEVCVSIGKVDTAKELIQRMEQVQVSDHEVFYCLFKLGRAYALVGETDVSHKKFMESFEKILAMENPNLRFKNLIVLGSLCKKSAETQLANESFRFANELALGLPRRQQTLQFQAELIVTQCSLGDFQGARCTFESMAEGSTKQGAAYVLAQAYAKEGNWTEVESYLSVMGEHEQSAVLLNFAGYHVKRGTDASEALRRVALLPRMDENNLQRYIRMLLLNADMLQQNTETRTKAGFLQYLAMHALECYKNPSHRIAAQLTIVKILSERRFRGPADL